MTTSQRRHAFIGGIAILTMWAAIRRTEFRETLGRFRVLLDSIRR